MAGVLADERVHRIRADQCQYGATVVNGHLKGSPILKPTGFMTNSLKVLEKLGRRCRGRDGACSRAAGGTHAICSGKIARDAAVYPKGLCRALLDGMSAQVKFDGKLQEGCFGIQAEVDEVPVDDPVMQAQASGKYRDDLTGQPLIDHFVLEARRQELAYFMSKGVWIKRPRGEAARRTGRPPISVRWVDVNKGDDQNPKYRSRLVARQLKVLDKSGESFFSPTPPLEALRAVLSGATTSTESWRPIRDPQHPNRTQVSTVDISRAYFNAKKDPDDLTYVDLPPEDDDHGRMCGLLVHHMYGTRGAADGWQEEYSTTLVSMGFRQGVSSACIFLHEERQLRCTVHGDDFTTVGGKEDLDWFEGEIEGHYECTIGPRLGPGPGDAKECTVLNRVVR